MHADVTPTTLEHIKAGNIHKALNPNQGVQGYAGFIATFLAAHPDLFDPFNDYKRVGLQPDAAFPSSTTASPSSPRTNADDFDLTKYMEGPLSRTLAHAQRATAAAAPAPSASRPELTMVAGACPNDVDPPDHRSDASRSARSMRCAASTSTCGAARSAMRWRRERRGQVDADEHHRRHPQTRQRPDRPRRQAGGASALTAHGAASSASASCIRRSRSAPTCRSPRTS